MQITLTIEEVQAIADALQFSIDNGLADEYEDTELLYATTEKFNKIVSGD